MTRTMKRAMAVVVGVALVAGVGLGLLRSAGSERAESVAAVDASAETSGQPSGTSAPDEAGLPASTPGPGPSAAHGLVVGDGVTAWRAADFRQTWFQTGFRFVEVRDEKRDPQSGDWNVRTHSATSSFSIIWTGFAHQDLFCVAGFADDGDFVLERWELEPVMIQTTGPGGVQVFDAATDENGMVVKRFHRAEIYRGPLATGVHDVEFDREERFMMALVVEDDEDLILYGFENEVGAEPVPVLHSDTLPELARMRFLRKFDHAVLGRVWRMEDHPIWTTMILLRDSDNDGTFDGPPIIADPAFLEAAGLEDYELWDSLLGP